MAYIPSWQELRDHPKTLRVARALDVRRTSVIGLLHCLWWWALDYASDGDLTGFDDADIAAAAEWEGDPGVFVAALAECGVAGRAGFLDRSETGYGLHDWAEYGGKYVEKRARDAQRKRDVRATSSGRATDVAGRGDKRREEKNINTMAAAENGAAPDDPMPLEAANGSTFAETLAAWARRHGMTIPRGASQTDRFGILLRFVVGHLGNGHTRLHGVAIGVIGDYVARVTDAPMNDTARNHLARLVKTFGPTTAFEAMTEAVTWGAGLDPEHAADVKALTKYATTVIKARAEENAT